MIFNFKEHNPVNMNVWGWLETVVNRVTKSSGQGGTGVLAPIRECPPGGWRGKKERGKDRRGRGSQKGPTNTTSQEVKKQRYR